MKALLASATNRLGMTKDPSTNEGCGASIQEYADVGTTKYYDASWCPQAGAIKMIDGVYAATGMTTTDFKLTKGQSVMIWVSCTTWSSAQAGAFTLTLEKL